MCLPAFGMCRFICFTDEPYRRPSRTSEDPSTYNGASEWHIYQFSQFQSIQQVKVSQATIYGRAVTMQSRLSLCETDQAARQNESS